MRFKTRDNRRRTWSMLVTGAVISGAIVGTGAWLGGRSRRPARFQR